MSRRRALLMRGGIAKVMRKVTSYYKFNEESTVAKDEFGSNLNQRHGTPVFEAGKLGLSCKFNANQTGFRLAGIPNSFQMYNDDGLLPFSISVWIKVMQKPATKTSGRVIGVMGLSSNQNQWYLTYDTELGLRFVKCDVTKYRTIMLQDALNLNEWYHIVYTDAGIGTEKFYVNGVLSSIAINDPDGYETFKNSNPYGIGISAHAQSNYANYYFPGAIDDIAIFKNYILSDYDIQWIYNQGNGREII